MFLETEYVMALCREPIAFASCSGRVEDRLLANLQRRHYSKPPIIRLRTSKDLMSCGVNRSQLRYAANTFRKRFGEPFAREREWQIRVSQIDLGEQSLVADGSENLQRFYATCEKGLEQILVAELLSPLISASQVEAGSGGVSFVGTQSTGYNATLWLRTGERVLCELARGCLPKGRTRLDHVYEFVREAANWPLILVDYSAPQTRTPQSHEHEPYTQSDRQNSSIIGSCRERVASDKQPLETLSEAALCTTNRYKFRIFAVQTRLLNCNGIKNQNSVSASVNNAIWDALRDACGDQWPEPPEREDLSSVPLFLSVNAEMVILYRDMSGISLYKRGYRDISDKTKPNEGLAAAVLTLAGWNHMVPGFGDANKNANAQGKDRILLDPFCGTGTFVIEAALMACNGAPGLMRRHWPFQTWHDYDQIAWTECRDVAAAMQTSSLSGARVMGNDMNDGVIAKCKKAARAAGVHHLLELSCETSRHYQPPAIPSLVVTNPPCSAPLTYASLRGEDERLLTLWQGFGQLLKSRCRGADAYVLSENDWLAHAMHMVPDCKWDLQPLKQWRGKLTGRRTDQIFGSHERKLLHFHVQSRYARGDPLSKIPFSSVSTQKKKQTTRVP